jgi:hypothetical protein
MQVSIKPIWILTWLALIGTCLPAAAADPAGGNSTDAGVKQAVAQDQQAPMQLPETIGSGWEVQRGLQSVLGIEVHTLTDRNTGRIIDLLADSSGNIQAVVIEFGGFLGLGTRKVAVDRIALRFENTSKGPVATADITRDQLRLAPEHKPGEVVAVLKPIKRAPSAETQ